MAKKPITVILSEDEAEEILIGLSHRMLQKLAGEKDAHRVIGYKSETKALGEKLSQIFEQTWGWTPGVFKRHCDRPVTVIVKVLRSQYIDLWE